MSLSNIQDEFNYSESYEEGQPLFDLSAELRNDSKFVDILSDCGGLNLYPSFNQIQDNLDIKQLFEFHHNQLPQKQNNLSATAGDLYTEKLKNNCEVLRPTGYDKVFKIERMNMNRLMMASSDNWKERESDEGSSKSQDFDKWSFTNQEMNENSQISSDIKHRFGRKQDKGNYPHLNFSFELNIFC